MLVFLFKYFQILFGEHVLFFLNNQRQAFKKIVKTALLLLIVTTTPRCPHTPAPVCVLGSQQPQVAVVWKHVFILNKEAVCTQGTEQRKDLGTTEMSLREGLWRLVTHARSVDFSHLWTWTW